MNFRILHIIFLCHFTFFLGAQELGLEFPNLVVGKLDVFDVNLKVNGFENLVSAQFSVEWAPDVIEFIDYENVDLSKVAIGDSDANDGILRLSWFVSDGKPISLADGKTMVRLRFKAIGEQGDESFIKITSNPLKIQIFKEVNEDYVQVNSNFQEGIVIIGQALNLQVEVINNVCFGDNEGAIILNNTDENLEYTWIGPNGFEAKQPNIEFLQTGEYILTVSDENSVLSVQAFLVEGPNAELKFDKIETEQPDCNDNLGKIKVEIQGGSPPYTYTVNDEVFENFNKLSLNPGTYTLKVEDSNGCVKEESILLFEYKGVNVEEKDSVSICNGMDYLLPVQGNYSSIQWSNGMSSAEINITIPGKYTFSITDDFGCNFIDSIYFNIDETPTAILSSDYYHICPKDTVFFNVSGGNSYEWIGSDFAIDDIHISNPKAYPEVTTEFGAVVSNSCGSDTGFVFVEVYETTATAGLDTCVLKGQPFNLNASGAVEYYWTGLGISAENDTEKSPELTINSSTNYFLVAVDKNMCVTFDTVQIKVDCAFTDDMKFNNIITPNGDLKNDFLEFTNLNLALPNALTVFNRWGGLVFEKYNYQTDEERFDGTYKGKLLPEGVYYYILELGDVVIKQTLLINYE